MKKLLLLTPLMLVSCNSIYYQVHQVKPENSMTIRDNALVYEDENCIASYNFWNEEGGDVGFMLYNKSDVNIYVNLEECFFVFNGIAYDYYKNRTFTSSRQVAASSSASKSFAAAITSVPEYQFKKNPDMVQAAAGVTSTTGVVSSSGVSVSYEEEKVICVPPRSTKRIAEYVVNKTLIRDCDLYRHPNKSQIKSLTFSKESSPFVFENRVVYWAGSNDGPIRFDNKFYIAEITNYPEKEIVEWRYDSFCGQRSQQTKLYFKAVYPDRFFIKYSGVGKNVK